VSIQRVHHINCGTMCPFGRRLLGQRGGWLERGRLVCHVLVLETARDGLILVDTGFSTEDVRDPTRLHRTFRALASPALDENETAIRQIEALGFTRDDVRHIVITHLDVDHAGGLVDFPGAQVHVHTREHRAAMERATLKEKQRYIPKQWAHDVKWRLHAERGDTWRDIPAIARLPDVDADVGMVPLVGHTRGHCAVIAKGPDDRWLVHAGDAYYHRDTLDGGDAPPGLRLFETAMQYDGAARLASIAVLRRLAEDDDVDIFSAHDEAELAVRRAAPARPEPYRDHVS
jgi:glyoxylase-like metal-dependent hydrolase (beta-lactamase superfamily II)